MDAIKGNVFTTELSSKEYHGMGGTYSSSQLKDMLDDPEFFYKKYITKEIEKEEATAFDVGTYFHTAILEPHLLEEECAVFRGGKRIGKEWEAFKANNAGKAIITLSEFEKAEKMIEAVKNSAVANRFLNGGIPEASAFATLYIHLDSESIYVNIQDVPHVLTPSSGWVPGLKIPNNTVKVVIKVRADYLNVPRGFVSDLKSTSGNCKLASKVMYSIRDYKYDMSAALYLDIFTAVTARRISDFYWIFASKDTGTSKTYYCSQEMVVVGRIKWSKAVVELAKYVSNNWTFEDTLEPIKPGYLEKEWLDQIAGNSDL